ncbi:MAG: prepilin-type N-terminal cleavage/methylation domain-containing protein [Actinomycetota bacterium]
MKGFVLVAARRLREEEAGFTLLELLNVVLILGILILTAGPTYLSTRDKAYKGTASANVKHLIAAARLYATDNYPNAQNDPNAAVSKTDSGYAGMTTTGLAQYDASASKEGYVNNSGTEASGVSVRATLDASHYCLYSIQGRWYAYQLNPNGVITVTTNGATLCT